MDAQPDAPAVDARTLTVLVIASAAAVLALAAVLRFAGLEMGLPHWGARPDEKPILDHTVLVAKGHFDYDWSVYPHAYVYLHWLWGELILQVQYGLGISASPDYAQVWQKEPARLHAIGRALSALAGVATVGLVMASTRRALDNLVALVAGLWLAACFLHVRDAHALKPDVLMGLFVTGAVVASAALAERPSLRSGAIAGLWVGAAAAAKYNGVVAAVPVCGAAWMGSSDSGLRRWFSPPLLIAGGSAALFFFATSPFVIVNPASLEMLQSIFAVVFPSSVAPTAETAPVFLGLAGPSAPEWAARFGSLGTAVYHGGFSLRYGIGLLPSLVAPFAVIWGLLSRVWLLRMSAILCIAWYAVVSLSPVMLSRYITPMVPALAILEAGLLVAGVRRYRSNQVALFTALGAVLLIAEPLFSAVQYDRIASRTDTRVLATDWLEDHARPGSRVAIAGTQFWFWGAPQLPAGLRAVWLEREDPLEPDNVQYLLTHDHELFWSSLGAERIRRIEQSAASLELVAEFDPAAGGTGTAVFEVNDAYYIPIHGFSAVTLPGPRIRIYRLR